MSLRLKTALIIIVTLLVIAGTLFLGLRTTVLNGVAEPDRMAGLLVVSLLSPAAVLGLLCLGLPLRTVILRPIARLCDGVAEIAASSDSSARLPVNGKDELARLAAGINNMLAALEHSQNEQRRTRVELWQSEQLLRNVLQSIPVGIWAADKDLHVRLWNAAMERITGLRRDQMLGHRLSARIPALESCDLGHSLEQVAASGEPVVLYDYGVDGSALPGPARHLNVLANPLRDSSGDTDGIVVTVEDISERKRTERVQSVTYSIAHAASEVGHLEDLLRYVQRELGTLIDTTNFYVAFVDREHGRLQFAYRADEHPSEAEYGDSAWRPLSRGLSEYILEMGQALLLTGQQIADMVAEGRVELIGHLPAIWLGVPLGNGGWPMGVIAVQSYRDADAYSVEDLALLQFVSSQIASVIERKRAEEKLAQERDLLQALMDSAQDTIYFKDTESRFTRINRAQARLLGVADPADAIGTTDADYFTPEHAAQARADEEEIMRTGRPLSDKQEHIRGADGEFRWVSTTKVPLFDRDGRVTGLAGITRDMTDRRHVQALLEQRTAAIEASVDGIAILDGDGHYAYLNNALACLYGYESAQELIGQNWRIHYDPPERRRFEREILPAVRATGRWRGETVGKQRDGTTFPQDVSLSALPDGGLVAIVRNMAEYKRLEAQFRQAQKMEAIGRLAGGVAHDFNNLLTAITGYASFARDSLPPQSSAREDITQVLSAAERAGNLTRQLLAFSRQQAVRPAIVNLNEVILNMGKMLRRLISEDIELVIAPAADLGAVKVDAGQIEQVLVNLVVNAGDAMPEGGRLTIETAPVTLDADYARQHLSVEPGEYILLAVSDTGCGMTDDVKARVFEPFFTTKETGKGTGLGLATCYAIVRQNGGHIGFYSEVGKGTTFKIYFPRVEGTPESASTVEEKPRRAPGKQTVLLVEDDSAVRTFASRALRESGYTVLEAANGSEALRLAAERNGEPIDLLITDVIMPHMGGEELARHLQSSHPEIRALFISGYTPNTIVRTGALSPHAAFLEKPFAVSSLVQRAREIIDGV